MHSTRRITPTDVDANGCIMSVASGGVDYIIAAPTHCHFCGAIPAPVRITVEFGATFDINGEVHAGEYVYDSEFGNSG